MFQFTSTNVINRNQDFTTGKPIWVAEDSASSFNVKRVGNFKADNIVAVYHSPYVEPRCSKATLDLNDVKDPKTQEVPVQGDHYRLSIYIRLDQSSQNSYYSNDLVFKGKPLSVEFVWQADAEATAAYLANIIKKYEVAVYEKPIVKISADEGVLTIDATDQYQRFQVVEVEWYDAKAYHGMGEYVPVLKALPEKIGVQNVEGKIEYQENPEVVGENKIIQGVEGFGTYEWLLHNLRLPTNSRTRAWALNKDESPIPGAHYDEFVIKYCVRRGVLGSNAVGDLVTSMTTHVFYINHDIASDFKDALENVLTNATNPIEIETVVSEYVKSLEPIEEPEHEIDTEGRN